MGTRPRSVVRALFGPPAVWYVRQLGWAPLAGRAAVLANSYLRRAQVDFVSSTSFGSAFGGNTRDFVQRYVYLFGVWQPDLDGFIAERLEEGDVFVDVGANVGYFTLLGSRSVGPSGGVIAIEASPEIFKGLEKNLALNEIRNVRALNLAASDRVGTLSVYRTDDDLRGLTTTVERRGLELECEVEAAPLNSLLTDDELKRTRLVKIDVEGSEWLVAVGLDRLLKEGRADLELVVEVEPLSPGTGGKRAGNTIRLFEDAGFNTYALETDYRVQGHLAIGVRARPLRLSSELELEEVDLVFSRIDAEQL